MELEKPNQKIRISLLFLKKKSSSPDTEVQSKHTATSTTSIEATEERETMKIETPVAKQTDYHLSYNQPAAASYDGWEKQALPVGNGEMGAKVFGLIGEERIQYNEKTLWSGGPQPDSTDYNGGKLPRSLQSLGRNP